MKKIITLAAMLAVAACGQAAGWNPPQGGTRASFERDAYDCRRDATLAGGSVRSGSITIPMEDWSVYRMCMRSRGYTGAAPGQGWFPSSGG